MHYCFSRKRCTFLILGSLCTRKCNFCAIQSQKENLSLPDRDELFNIRSAVESLGLTKVIITSVTRDDLEDGGAGHFAECIGILRGLTAGVRIELLVPDFMGNAESIEQVILAGPDVFAHNIETVPRLYNKVRPGADYYRSLSILRTAKGLKNRCITKSGVMVGLGETREEIYRTMKDIRDSGCDIITVGQYLRPDSRCLEVEEFLKPEEFELFSEWAREVGFKKYLCGPFVRSSYQL